MQTLFKYDFRATARYLTPLYLFDAIILIVAFALWSFDLTQQNLISTVFSFLFAISIALTALVPFLVLLMLYYERMHGNYASLTHSFPLPSGQKLDSQIWNFFVWSVLTTLIFTVQIGVLIWGRTNISLDQINEFVGHVLNYLNLSYWGLSALVALMLIMCIAFIFMEAIQYFGLITLSVRLFTTRHVLVGFIFLYILLTIFTLISSYALYLLFPYYFSIDLSAHHLAVSWFVSGDHFSYFEILSHESYFNVPWVSLCTGVLTTAAFYALTRYLLSKKVSIK